MSTSTDSTRASQDVAIFNTYHRDSGTLKILRSRAENRGMWSPDEPSEGLARSAVAHTMEQRGLARAAGYFQFAGPPTHHAIDNAWAIERSYVELFGEHSFAIYPAKVDRDYSIRQNRSGILRLFFPGWPLPRVAQHAGAHDLGVGDVVTYDAAAAEPGDHPWFHRIVAFDGTVIAPGIRDLACGADLRGVLLCRVPRMSFDNEFPRLRYQWAAACSLTLHIAAKDL